MVIIRRGPEKGMTGRVLEVLKDTRVPQVVVEGLNLVGRKGLLASRDRFLQPMLTSTRDLAPTALFTVLIVMCSEEEEGSRWEGR